jgi:hypothetical protein
VLEPAEEATIKVIGCDGNDAAARATPANGVASIAAAKRRREILIERELNIEKSPAVGLRVIFRLRFLFLLDRIQ